MLRNQALPDSAEKNKKVIFHLIYDLDVGGTEIMLLKICCLLRKNFKNYVICFCRTGVVGSQFQKKGIKVYYLNYRSFLKLPCVLLKFKRLVGSHKPDILSTYLPVADIFGRVVGRILKIPKIICNVRSTHKDKRYKKIIFFDYLTNFLVDKYIVNSKEIINYYPSLYKFNKSKFTYIPNALDLLEYSGSIDKVVKKKSLNIQPDNLVISCIANLHINKGHQYLLEAFEKVYQKNQKINLLIIGDGKQKSNLLKKSRNYQSKPNILFLGQRSDIKELLAITSIFVLPTLFEGMSNVLLEAMASKCAIITTDIPENKELIENKKTGLLVPIKNSKLLADTIKELINTPKKRFYLGEKARKRVEEEFTIVKIEINLIKFYDNLK